MVSVKNQQDEQADEIVVPDRHSSKQRDSDKQHSGEQEKLMLLQPEDEITPEGE